MAIGRPFPTIAPARRPRRRSSRTVIVLATTMVVALAIAPLPAVMAKDPSDGSQPIVGPAAHSDVSAPLSSMTPAPVVDAKDKKEKKKYDLPFVGASGTSDPAVQSVPGAEAAPSTTTSFDGIGKGLGTYSPRWAPPDTNGAVGPDHYFEIVNADIAIFSKSGALIYGPVGTNTLWSGFGGSCEARDDGDGVVEYDRLAGRWVVTQFTNDNTNTECVAVSTTGDPMGTYARYSFTYSAFPDYPKLAVWPDAYYITFNLFGANGFAGGMVCAYDRASMLAVQPATQQCFNLGTSYGGLLPADVDGSTPPPTSSREYVLNYGANRLNLWKFHVDWANSSNTTLSGPTAIGVAAFSPACSGGCVPQPATTQKLDTLSDRLMSRLAYRNFGDHESLVVNHSVGTGFLNQGPAGVRWYELRSPGGTPSVYQQGTYAPDSTYRWMGSIAMDGAGNIGLGYSASSSSVRPSIRYSGHLTTDPLGVMGQGEGILQAGTGSQLPNLGRWGDYSSMTIDPSDDCAFWYAGEYLKTDGTWNWSTRIGSFRFPNCGASTATAPGAPTAATATAGNGQATVSFSPPASNGGSPITSYTVTSTLSGITASGAASPITVTGLTNGTAYTFTVHATNAVGSGPESAASNSVTPTAAAPATITTTSLPAGRFSAPYTATLQASGGVQPYTWRIASGALPSGLALNPSSGTISGTPTKVANFSFTVEVSDSSSPTQTATKAMTIKISKK
jgi:Putative Ig domain/Fibronectin type III domain